MTLLGDLAAGFISKGLEAMLVKGKQDPATVGANLVKAGQVLEDLGGKVADGKITEAEIEDTLAKMDAAGNDPIVLMVKAAVSRLLEQLLGGK